MDTKPKVFEILSRNVTLVDRAREQVENLIISGTLQLGQRLPSERKLGEMLGVSRTVVRETIRALAANGLIEVRRGLGNYVGELGPGMIRDSVSLLLRANRLTPQQVFELRSVLEITVAGLSAERARAEDIAAISAEISALDQEDLPIVEYAKHDFGFHARLAESTHNPLFFALINLLSTVIIEKICQLYSSGLREHTYRSITKEHHSLILHHVKKHNVDGARQAMANHMGRSLDLLQEMQGTITLGATDKLQPFK
jgi:GntR family transcriptional repressor for pyruvate dehydrogenase complex